MTCFSFLCKKNIFFIPKTLKLNYFLKYSDIYFKNNVKLFVL